jgi:hypothetical protein
MGLILLVVLILLLLGAFHPGITGNWGYAPSGLLGTVLVIVLILFLLGRI